MVMTVQVGKGPRRRGSRGRHLQEQTPLAHTSPTLSIGEQHLG